jgi:hypothetical protein
MAGIGSWLKMELPIERMLTLEKARRLIPRIELDDLRAIHDSLLVSYVHQEHILNQAMRRVAELEIQSPAMVGVEHENWARELYKELEDQAKQDRRDGGDIERSTLKTEYNWMFRHIVLSFWEKHELLWLLLYSLGILCLFQGT